MQELEFLKSLVIIFSASAIVVFLLNWLKIPSLVGFLIAGTLIGPYGIGFIKDVHSVEILAEIGVMLLLFTIGIEFSVAKLIKMKKTVLEGGGLQVSLTILLSTIAAYTLTRDINKSLFLGFLISLSSTAILFKLLAERGEIDTPHGRSMIGILIFQDICVVPLMLFTPILSGEKLNLIDIAIKMGKAVFIIVIVILSARWIVPVILHNIVKTKSRELFITTIILLCLGIALLTSKFGLSLALGAFLAGIVISESEYAHQATSDILPFKDSFIGMFFVSVGMLMDISYVFDNFSVITIAVISIFCMKVLTGTLSVLIIKNPLRTAFHSGFGLAQVGEFSFVLAVLGKKLEIITDDFYQIFLSSSVISMMMTPFTLKYAPFLSAWITSRHLLKRVAKLKSFKETTFLPKKKGHVIIIGFGLNGRNLAHVLKNTEIPYVVLDLNIDTVQEMRKKGEPIYYGDGTSKEILHKLRIESADLLVIAISDPISTRRIVSIARHENPNIYIIVRTRYLAEVDELIDLGANEVIPEEFETSIEIFSRVLHHYHVPRNIIADYIDNIRKNSYNALRTIDLPKKPLTERYEFLKDIETETYLIKEESSIGGHTIKDLHLRAKTGVTIIAVQRDNEIHQNPSPDFVLKKGDILLLIGKKRDINKAIEYLESDRFIVAKYD